MVVLLVCIFFFEHRHFEISHYGRNVDTWSLSFLKVKQCGFTEVGLMLPLYELFFNLKSFSSVWRTKQMFFFLKDLVFSVELQH